MRNGKFVFRIGVSTENVALSGDLEVSGRWAVVFSHRGADSNEE
jgi:hypothetical protein